MSSDPDTMTLPDLMPMIAGQSEPGQGPAFEVLDKYHLTPVSTGQEAGPAQLERMIDRADAAFQAGAPGPHERGEILDRAARLIAERAAEVAHVIMAESGFTAADARGEVNRCLQTLRLSAEEARGLRGEIVPISGAPGQSRRMAFTLRVPLGVVLAVTPFNSPLNTVTHKIAPAFAAGNAVIVKPASATPLTTLKLAELLTEAGMPPGFLSVLLGGSAITQAAIADPRIRFIAFTGSTGVGRAIQSAAGLRRTQMELGSIAFTVLCDDGDLDRALPRIVGASYRKAGQVCTSVQCALVHRSRLAETQARLVKEVRAVRFGDPAQDGVLTGPLISEESARRVETWIDEAMDAGATRLVGGARNGAVVPPTLLSDVTPDMRVVREEVFGPVLCLIPFDTIDEAIGMINATPYGLATGVFTNRLDQAFDFARRLDVGGVHINETSSSRVDLMPYGGTKDSGFGREGPKYAVEEMTEQRIITITT
ncbi:aldehyde dehydrogenase family protein [Puniceibacterium sediminis]|uniref:Succinate-semialdehyde dehydrogenase / glutarate-semialdehyde dehydrogenase n=1 Tax=Puniceibacterium sediminis TaxID=1608407 RepID=A0A238X708_9RHOB|nr:aldehyde dehydrogenase family protein [Puniceibacterium sediminis]SNR54368.1 succinate-semialdehyde dehydrogenase / glutarate-semialdehyde dehydrogenase [Puniceibacterium sediminis]